MKATLCFLILTISLCAADTSLRQLTLEDVYANIEKTFPSIILSTREIRKAEFDILSAQGAFDLAIKGSATNNTGYYGSNRFESNLEKPTSIWGTSFFAGYRVSSGDFPDYYGERRTNSAGEVRFGGRIPLWRDRSIDQNRLDLKQSEIQRQIADKVLNLEKLAVYRDAAASYYNWVAAGKRRKIVQDLLVIAEKRSEQIRKRAKLGDIPAIEERENTRAILARKEQVAAADRLLRKSALYLSLYHRNAEGGMIIPENSMLPPEFAPETALEAEIFERDKLYALENRPELKKLMSEIEMEKNALAFHENQRGAQLDLILRGSRDIQNGTNFRRDPWEGDFSLVFNIPLQTRKQDGKIGGTETKIDILRTKYAFQKDKIGLEANDARIGVENALQRLKIIREELVVAESLAVAEKARFDLGDTTLLIVNLREQAAAEVALRLVGAEVDYWIAQADYDAVMMKRIRAERSTG